MIEFLKNIINGKRLLILGFGREGESTYRFLRKHFSDLKISIADKNENIVRRINDNNIEIITGENYLNSIAEYDLVFKSPGISLSHPEAQIDRGKITSQTDLFLDYYSEQIIGVTGTKGKSTTSSLIYHIIKLFTRNVVFVGNIGVPPFDMIEEISERSRIVCELSSHQLEFISKGPHIGILLNLFQEHLDHYLTFEDYQLSKFHLTLYQKSSDNFIFNDDDSLIKKLMTDNKLDRKFYGYSLNRPQSMGCWVSNEEIIFSDGRSETVIFNLNSEHNLKGQHNVLNIMAAICACKITGIPDEKISEGIKTFKGLEHRIEFVGEFDGVRYYNDSIATIPEATIEAIKTLVDVETLILGGFDRGIDYDHLLEFLLLSTVKNIIFLGDAGRRMMKGLEKLAKKNQNIFFADTFENAVMTAKINTRPNGTCLLSPAAASYDMFKNFEERGQVYKKLVRGL